MNSYINLKNKQQKEIDDFPFFFAFNRKQFAEGMAKFGLSPDETDKVCALHNTGGFYLRTDEPKLHEMGERHARELKEAIEADSDGEGFVCEMFLYELDNHEFSCHGYYSGAFDSLGFTADDVENSEILKRGLEKAVAEIKGRED
jgi:hypothetical protein